ncbi:MAG TPA: hypothetical protein PKX87_01685 [Alphaproteobacteria bacterium]|nr:hypothetical protein [Alphaproteobacteria bacterium]
MSLRSAFKLVFGESFSFSFHEPKLSSRFNAAARHYRPDESPAYDPRSWRCSGRNCYTYALNIPEHGWGRPGQLMLRNLDRRGLEYGPYIEPCASVLNSLLQGDGLVRVDHSDFGLYKHILFSCLDTGPQNEMRDFHFYRRDSNGLWSHKAGPGAVSDRDENGGLIVSPETCDRGRYTTDVGYYAVPPEGIRYVVP